MFFYYLNQRLQIRVLSDPPGCGYNLCVDLAGISNLAECLEPTAPVKTGHFDRNSPPDVHVSPTIQLYRLTNILPIPSCGFGGLRISHPIQGRVPGTQQEEAELIEKIICILLTHDEGTEVVDWSDAEDSLTSRGEAAENKLGSPWPDFVARPMCRTTRVAKGSGPRALTRALDTLSLLYTVRIELVGELHQSSLPELLVYAPALRFDRLD
jgi:hypothetical protein